ncbi:hypothetical protein [Pseudomonas sp. ESBL9]|uniref:hypothetical protein n=1 Tax=Pseudomonas sp. ESBL9 TaxID=3077327 RepID=UPI002FC9B565
MSVSEQELFGLMAVAQEQQQAAVVAIERLEAQRAALEQTVEQARTAVREMEMAGKTSALIIEKATRIAVSEAVSGALAAVRDEETLGGSIKPAVNALDGVAGRAELAEQRLSQTAASFSWQWGALWAGTAALLLAVVLGIVLLVVPSPDKIAKLRAEVANLEARGGKAVLTVCGPEKRLCGKIDTKAPEYGERGQFQILKGY